MSTPNGYNNPAYCHQYDSSLYDYQYVPEIDPDSPDLGEESNRRVAQTKLVHPKFYREFSESDEFEGSDESNRSIIVEECNNRRVTLICEKRSKAEADKDEFFEDGGYYQDISLESENGYGEGGNKTVLEYEGKTGEERSLRHQRPLDPPAELGSGGTYSGGINHERRTGLNSNFKQSTASINSYHRPKRYHRYEEIPSKEDYIRNEPIVTPSVHRYAEISSDENGYPTLTKEINLQQNRDRRQKENYPPRLTSKPRAISPINYPGSFSPPLTPNRPYQRTPYSKAFEHSAPQLSPNFTGSFVYSSSPKTNSFEMAELSPPRAAETLKYSGNDQTFFIRSPKRQPPIGASAAAESQEPYGRCILPKNLQQSSSKSGRERSHSAPNSPKRRRDSSQIVSSPSTTHSDRKISQVFHIKPVKSNPKNFKSKAKVFSENNPARRNISNSFTDPPKEFATPPKMPGSPYKPTTEIIPPKTAIITPIFQRKNHHPQQNEYDTGLSPKRNFEKMSQAFQSTGNIFRSTREPACSRGTDLRSNQDKLTRIKRNQSVPNFSQTLAAESRIMAKKSREIFHQENEKYSRNLDFQYSPKKPIDHMSPIDKSRISLIDQTRSSWTISETDFHHPCSTCFIFAAIVHLVTATATCAISFYLLSKVGRRYYLDFGLLAGFVNFILGLLGFRSYCWRWLPNRNYVSGFIGLAAFSALTCGGLTYLITARPMAGDPVLDIMGGAICAVSVLTIVLALTGLTMSGCCKAPPPDNRVTDI